jgi:hypothetical protein
MIWNLSRTATELLQEEYEKLGRLKLDDTLGDTYKNICIFKLGEIGRELRKRNAQIPGGVNVRPDKEFCALCGRATFDYERVFLHNGQTVCEDCMEQAGRD